MGDFQGFHRPFCPLFIFHFLYKTLKDISFNPASDELNPRVVACKLIGGALAAPAALKTASFGVMSQLKRKLEAQGFGWCWFQASRRRRSQAVRKMMSNRKCASSGRHVRRSQKWMGKKSHISHMGHPLVAFPKLWGAYFPICLFGRPIHYKKLRLLYWKTSHRICPLLIPTAYPIRGFQIRSGI